mmetsp:Transcript_29467/g.70171  ORF Transcript_29467/g.70171 Transcript_29467/m.70171 type:complete len:131 (-) Transcript_29467:2215-2607(-)
MQAPQQSGAGLPRRQNQVRASQTFTSAMHIFLGQDENRSTDLLGGGGGFFGGEGVQVCGDLGTAPAEPPVARETCCLNPRSVLTETEGGEGSTHRQPAREHNPAVEAQQQQEEEEEGHASPPGTEHFGRG